MDSALELETALGVTFFDYQLDAFADLSHQPSAGRLCLYYRTGAGKSITALCALKLAGWHEALVIAPPITHPAWEALGETLDMEITAVSHAKFRMSNYLVKRDRPVVADEFHLFGGHAGKGWRKLDRLARSLPAPMLLLSATPNYNDAERVYCIQHILDPHSVKGGYLQFIYANCTTEENQFGSTPLVTGFQRFKGAPEYLTALPHVHYVPDTAEFEVVDIEIQRTPDAVFENFGLSRRRNRIMASIMEARHTDTFEQYVGEDLLIRPHIMSLLEQLDGSVAGPVLYFCNSSRIAEALHRTAASPRFGLITGKVTPPVKNELVFQMTSGHLDGLIGTASLATGTDGLDRVCDTLVIVQDTDDDALRRQLIGRILPRGAASDTSNKKIYRLVLSS